MYILLKIPSVKIPILRVLVLEYKVFLMKITTIVLLHNLKIKSNYFFKLLNKCGFSNTNIFSINDLIVLRDCLKTKHFKSKLLVLEINKKIDLLKAHK